MWRTAIGLEQGPVSATLLFLTLSHGLIEYFCMQFTYITRRLVLHHSKKPPLFSPFSSLSFPLPSSPLFHSTEQHNPERIQTSPKRAFTAMSCQLPNPPLQKQLRHVHSESHVLLLNESDCRLSANMMVPILPIFGD